MMNVRISAALMAADNLSKPEEEQEALYIEFPFVDEYGQFNDERLENMLKLLKVKDFNYILDDVVLYVNEVIYDNLKCFDNMTAEQVNKAAIALQEYDEKVFEAAFEFLNIEDLVEMNPQDFILVPSIYNYEDLGYYYAEELGCLDIPENIQSYFNYEAYGRDLFYDLNGNFSIHGWIEYLG